MEDEYCENCGEEATQLVYTFTKKYVLCDDCYDEYEDNLII
jgi:hypothetical protein